MLNILLWQENILQAFIPCREFIIKLAAVKLMGRPGCLILPMPLSSILQPAVIYLSTYLTE